MCIHRNISIMIEISYSLMYPPNYCSPQGSVLGPSLFSIYIRPIVDIIKNTPNIHYHILSDDIQLGESNRIRTLSVSQKP